MGKALIGLCLGAVLSACGGSSNQVMGDGGRRPDSFLNPPAETVSSQTNRRGPILFLTDSWLLTSLHLGFQR